MKSFIAASLLGLMAGANAHMEISNPAPFRSKFNSFTTDIDYSMTNPLSASGSDFPCKGYHNLLDTPQGQSVANYQPGQSYSFTITGSATHNGGSCQVSLSFDRGSTWTVIQSFIGNCPLRESWDFTIPNDTPTGSALWAWSWWNQVGNREMYMNCAHVTIGGGREAESAEVEAREEADVSARLPPSDPFGSRPAMFVANVGNGCGTLEGSDVLFPNPGPDVVNESSKTANPVGSCGGSGRIARTLRA